MSNEEITDTLILGYGNPGRQDDGLGPEFVRRVEDESWPGVTTQMNYQLTVEDAVDIAKVKRVIFVDASMQQRSFSFSPVAATPTQLDPQPIASHSLSPESLMTLSRTLFNAQAEAWVLAIQGFEFDRFEEKLSPGAEGNLQQALRYCHRWLRDQNSEETGADA